MVEEDATVTVLTPTCKAKVLAAGYVPEVHSTVGWPRVFARAFSPELGTPPEAARARHVAVLCGVVFRGISVRRRVSGDEWLPR